MTELAKKNQTEQGIRAVSVESDGTLKEAHTIAPIDGWEKLSYGEEVSERFKDLQQLLGFSDDEMAEKIGFTRWEYHLLITMSRVPSQIRKFAEGCDSLGVGMDALLAKKHSGLPWRVQEFFSMKEEMRHEWARPKQQLMETVERLKTIEGCETPESTARKTGKSLHTCSSAFNGDQGSLDVIADALYRMDRINVGWFFTGME